MSSDKRKRHRAIDGTPIWAKRNIDGPGIWATCVKGKEKQAIGELYELFDSLASDLWPTDATATKWEESDEEDLSIEVQIAKELAHIKRPRAQQRFRNCQTNTQCLLFIACSPPVDPVTLVVQHMRSIQNSGITRTRYAQRLVPASGTCVTNLPEIQALCRKVIGEFFSQREGKSYKYKIELRIRNHTTLKRPVLIESIAQCMPSGHTVDLSDPDVFVLVEIFKSICSVSVVEDYYRLRKFNVAEVGSSASAGMKTSAISRIAKGNDKMCDSCVERSDVGRLLTTGPSTEPNDCNGIIIQPAVLIELTRV